MTEFVEAILLVLLAFVVVGGLVFAGWARGFHQGQKTILDRFDLNI